MRYIHRNIARRKCAHKRYFDAGISVDHPDPNHPRVQIEPADPLGRQTSGIVEQSEVWVPAADRGAAHEPSTRQMRKWSVALRYVRDGTCRGRTPAHIKLAEIDSALIPMLDTGNQLQSQQFSGSGRTPHRQSPGTGGPLDVQLKAVEALLQADSQSGRASPLAAVGYAASRPASSGRGDGTPLRTASNYGLRIERISRGTLAAAPMRETRRTVSPCSLINRRPCGPRRNETKALALSACGDARRMAIV
jgi:hypothetical protein